jgi:tRNA(Ile)-lysidine synthase
MRTAAVAIAELLRVELDIVTIEVPAGASPEGRARTVRYAALEEGLRPGEQLLTGHTRDDQAETVLGNLLRGAGLEGLSGIPRRRGPIVRPLLSVTRSDIRELAALLRLPWRDDPANDDPEPRRNALRRRVIPDLEASFNRELRRALAVAGDRAAAAVAALEARAEVVPVLERRGALLVLAPMLEVVDPLTAATALRSAVRRLRGPYAADSAEVERLLEVAAGRTTATQLTGGFVARRRGPWLELTEPDGTPLEPAAWPVPGTTVFGLLRLNGRIERTAPVALPLSRWTSVLDADAVAAGLTVRAAQAGDRLDDVDIDEVLRSAGVPPDERRRHPVVVCEERLVWVPGARASRSVWIGDDTRRYLWVDARLEER